jgi:hypothetical protein
MANVLRTIIVPANLVTDARNFGSEIDSHGEGMYLTGLSPNGLEPATHYVSSGWMDENFAAILEDGAAINAAATAGAAAQGKTKKTSKAKADALVTASTVHKGTKTETINGQPVEVSEDPHALFARLGLKLINLGV